MKLYLWKNWLHFQDVFHGKQISKLKHWDVCKIIFLVNWPETSKTRRVKRVYEMFFMGNKSCDLCFETGNAWGCTRDSSNRCTELMKCARKRNLCKCCIISFANLFKTTNYWVFLKPLSYEMLTWKF